MCDKCILSAYAQSDITGCLTVSLAHRHATQEPWGLYYLNPAPVVRDALGTGLPALLRETKNLWGNSEFNEL